MSNQTKRCEVCGTSMSYSRYCGAWVCDSERCGDHAGLVRCYCGWSASGGNGYTELEEWGETIEPEY